MKALAAVFLAGALLFLFAGCGGESGTAGDQTTTESPTTTESATTPASPRQRVREALGDEVSAGGYAGDVQIHDVRFVEVPAEVLVWAKTPEGGLEGASCGDLDDGAQAIFETIYNDAGWKRGASLFYEGGLVDSSTGEELPKRITGTYTMPKVRARRIVWSDEDVLSNIDWSNYRNFCHPALQ